MERLTPPPDSRPDDIANHLDVAVSQAARRLYGPRYAGVFIDREAVPAGVLTVLVVGGDLEVDLVALQGAVGGSSEWFTVAEAAFTDAQLQAELERISGLLRVARVVGSAVSSRVVEGQFLVIAEVPEAEVHLRRSIQEGISTPGITLIRPGIVAPTPP